GQHRAGGTGACELCLCGRPVDDVVGGVRAVGPDGGGLVPTRILIAPEDALGLVAVGVVLMRGGGPLAARAGPGWATPREMDEVIGVDRFLGEERRIGSVLIEMVVLEGGRLRGLHANLGLPGPGPIL